MDIQAFSEKWIRQLRHSSSSTTATTTTAAQQKNLNSDSHLTKDEIQLLLNHLECSRWLEISTTSLVPSSQEEVQVVHRLRHTQQWIRKYHDNPIHLESARKVIPFASLSEKAEKRVALAVEKGKRLEMDQALILETLDWFKNSFFKWVDKIPCSSCDPPHDISILQGTLTQADRDRGVTRVELHQCLRCRRTTRFPRLHSPSDVLATRQGRCGEWANAFLLIGKAMGFETRYVMDWADHVWNEIKVPSLQRWVHVDACENLMDAPLVYSLGWKKTVRRVYAIDGGYVMDVFHRYTQQEPKPTKSLWLKRAEQSLCASGLRFTPTKLDCLLDQAYAYLDCKQSITSDSLQGRKSGDENWKASRGECRTFPSQFLHLDSVQLQQCHLVGHALHSQATLELTPSKPDQRGGLWLPHVIDPLDSFCIEWVMEITGNGADGLAFVIQGESKEALGLGGCGLGYAGIPKSLAIEFDTFYSPQEGDPDDNHVSIQSCLKQPNSSHHDYSLGCFSFPQDLNTGLPIQLRVLHEAGGQFSIWVCSSNRDWKELFAFQFGLGDICDSTDSLYLGFTAATGGVAQRHVIQSIQFRKLN